MAYISDYHRPQTIAEALDLLSRTGAVVLGGGTSLNGLPEIVPTEVIDLQSLGLDRIEYADGELHVGAMVTLTELAGHEMTPAAIVQLIRREAPNTIRNAATLGGSVGDGDPESPLLAGLLAFDARVTLAGPDGSADVALAEALSGTVVEGRIVEAVHFTVSGAASWESTARTPADKPIVLVVGRVDPSGSLRLAATGVASAPVVIEADSIGDLDPPGDFRGSAEYRRHLADVLSRRVTEALQ